MAGQWRADRCCRRSSPCEPRATEPRSGRDLITSVTYNWFYLPSVPYLSSLRSCTVHYPMSVRRCDGAVRGGAVQPPRWRMWLHLACGVEPHCAVPNAPASRRSTANGRRSETSSFHLLPFGHSRCPVWAQTASWVQLKTPFPSSHSISLTLEPPCSPSSAKNRTHKCQSPHIAAAPSETLSHEP